MSLIPCETWEKKKKFHRIFKHFYGINLFVTHSSTVFYTALPGGSPRMIGSSYGSVSLASQSRDTMPYPETLPTMYCHVTCKRDRHKHFRFHSVNLCYVISCPIDLFENLKSHDLTRSHSVLVSSQKEVGEES